MDLDSLYQAIEAESDSAYGADGGLSDDRASAIDRYLGKNSLPAPDGRSQVVDRSVYETIQWIEPSLARIFANGDDVIDVTPVGPEDEAGAKQEGQYLNYVLLERNDWVSIFDTASKDALLNRAGYLYAYKKMRRQVEVERYERQTQAGLALILKDQPKVLDLKEYPDDTEQAPQQPQMDPMTGQPIPTPPAMLYDIEIRREKEDPAFCVEVLPPERCRISKRCKTVQLKDSPYFEYYDYPTISSLRADGLDIPDDVEMGDDPFDTPEDASRNLWGEISEDSVDPSMKRVLTRWVWILYDFDGDGIAELNYCIVVGRKVVHREEVTRIPVAVLAPDPLPHRHVGTCPAESVADIQDIKTVILRGALDNLQLTNNARVFVTPMVNLDDVLNNRPGGVIRGKQGAVFGADIAPIPVPPVFPQAMEAYGFMEQVQEGRTGVNRYFQGTDQNQLNKTASGIQQLSTMASQRVEQVARMYSPGIVELGSILHELILKAGKFVDKVKLKGQWVDVDPTNWRKRTDFKIVVGYAAGNKDSLSARLMSIAQMQAQALEGGLPIVTPRNAYETAMELTKAADLSMPERFWTDPNTMPPKPPTPDPQLEVEKVKGQFTLQKSQMDNQTKERIAQLEAQVDKYKTDLEAQKDLALAQHQAETGAVMQDKAHQQALESEGVKTHHTAQLEHVKSQLAPETEQAKQIGGQNGKLDQLGEAVHELQEGAKAISELVTKLSKLAAAPRELIRDKAGRPTGSRVVMNDAE